MTYSYNPKPSFSYVSYAVCIGLLFMVFYIWVLCLVMWILVTEWRFEPWVTATCSCKGLFSAYLYTSWWWLIESPNYKLCLTSTVIGFIVVMFTTQWDESLKDSCMQFWFVSVIHKYLNILSFSKDCLYVVIFTLHSVRETGLYTHSTVHSVYDTWTYAHITVHSVHETWTHTHFTMYAIHDTLHSFYHACCSWDLNIHPLYHACCSWDLNIQSF